MINYLSKVKLAILVTASMFLSLATQAQAAQNTATIDPAELEGLIRNVVQLLIAVTAVVSLVRIIQGGYMVATSQGDPKSLGEGKEILTSAITGLMFALVGLSLLGYVVNNIIG